MQSACEVSCHSSGKLQCGRPREGAEGKSTYGVTDTQVGRLQCGRPREGAEGTTAGRSRTVGATCFNAVGPVKGPKALEKVRGDRGRQPASMRSAP